ncbi:3'-5' exonuclease [Allopontixanthobacter sediminis]|uniref:DNA polymerase III subunit epsilon n=1 Tax=Allopontixanthobacter sediminis TaxID=1689985 RepID=A0A845B9Y5_9SPHN|nr:3'-5' exonuclease [Allopontixanthobacter sediminis]MXP44409.1 DNA polymerase III subunit epsilon [Allopontixanthobacter sediminis]
MVLGQASPVSILELIDMTITYKNGNPEWIADQLIGAPGYRVLRAVPPSFSVMPSDGTMPGGRCVAIIDCETTGLDVQNDAVIELAIMLAFVGMDGQVTGHFGPVSWLQDPGVELDPRITLLTGLTNKDLAGHAIKDGTAAGLIDRADICVAHNARFDAAWIEKRFPQFAGKPWACSASDIDWLMLGYDGRAQQHLLMQHGRFANAHRAGDDVWSLFHLLKHEQPDPDGRTTRSHLQRLLKAADATTFRVEAVSAPYAAKDRLKAHGYRWEAARKVWWKELRYEELTAECRWFRAQELPPFRTEQVTSSQRHR